MKFTKANLKTGDVILRRDGTVEIVIVEMGELITPDGYNDLDEVREDLMHAELDDLDIMAVRRPQYVGDCCFDAFEDRLGRLVYKRKS